MSPGPDEPVGTVDITGLTDLALSPDGRRLYVSTDEPSLAVYEVDSGRKLTSVSTPAGAIEISPTGTLVAVAKRPRRRAVRRRHPHPEHDAARARRNGAGTPFLPRRRAPRLDLSRR